MMVEIVISDETKHMGTRQVQHLSPTDINTVNDGLVLPELDWNLPLYLRMTSVRLACLLPTVELEWPNMK